MPKAKLPVSDLSDQSAPPREPEKSDSYVGPGTLAEIIGQTDAIKRLATLVSLHKRSSSILGHILLVGPEGHGKRTIAHALAHELGVNIRETEASYLWRAGDLAANVADLEKGDIFLLRGVNQIRREPLDPACDHARV